MPNRSGLEITVKGQYLVADSGGNAIKMFKNEIFYLPETMVIQTGFENYVRIVDGRRVKRARPKKEKVSTRMWVKHIIRRLCLPARLKEKYEDYKGIREFYIENLKLVTELPKTDLEGLDETAIAKMSLSQLLAFCTMEGIVVPIDSYPDIDDARQAVRDEYDALKRSEGLVGVETQKETTKAPALGQPGAADEMEPTKEQVGEDGVKEEHFIAPGLEEKEPSGVRTTTPNPLLD